MIELTASKKTMAEAEPGDRVRIIKPGTPSRGRTGVVMAQCAELSQPGVRIRYDNDGGEGEWYHTSVELI